MNRRTFLKTSTAATVTAATGPIILGADDKAGSKAATVGKAEHTYECHHNWGKLEGELEWQTTHNVALDSAGLVYITHQGIGKKIDTVLVFEPSGKFVRSFGKDWHGGGHGIEVRKEGKEEFLYLTNTWTPQHKIVKTTLKGEVVWSKGRPEAKEYEDPKTPFNPTNVSFLPDGGFHVGDGYGSHYMLRYDKDGKFVSLFGGAGDKPGKFKTPHGQWLDTRREGRPDLVVCDRANARLQYFTPDGAYLSQSNKGEVLFPANIDTYKDVLMVPDLHARISLFFTGSDRIIHLGEDQAWREKVVGSLGKGPAVRSQPKEWVDGKFVHPHDAAFDKDGNIYCVEWVQTGRITFLKKVG